MATINPYLTFDGTCEAAFLFYKNVFGGEFEYMGRFKDMPENPEYPVSEADKNKVMHVSLPISKETILFGSDSSSDFGGPITKGSNFSISVTADSKEDADHIFNGLSKDGNIITPMEMTFWDSYFGMLTDQFGIQWMVSFDIKK